VSLCDIVEVCNHVAPLDKLQEMHMPVLQVLTDCYSPFGIFEKHSSVRQFADLSRKKVWQGLEGDPPTKEGLAHALW
jgi:hypothetical protein